MAKQQGFSLFAMLGKHFERIINKVGFFVAVFLVGYHIFSGFFTGFYLFKHWFCVDCKPWTITDGKASIVVLPLAFLTMFAVRGVYKYSKKNERIVTLLEALKKSGKLAVVKDENNNGIDDDIEKILLDFGVDGITAASIFEPDQKEIIVNDESRELSTKEIKTLDELNRQKGISSRLVRMVKELKQKLDDQDGELAI